MFQIVIAVAMLAISAYTAIKQNDEMNKAEKRAEVDAEKAKKTQTAEANKILRRQGIEVGQAKIEATIATWKKRAAARAVRNSGVPVEEVKRSKVALA